MKYLNKLVMEKAQSVSTFSNPVLADSDTEFPQVLENILF